MSRTHGRWSLRIFAGLLACVGLAGCSWFDRESHSLGEARATYTGADRRMILASPVNYIPDGNGKTVPKQVTCAEPSPDIAVAISSSFNAGVSLEAAGAPAGVPAEMQAQIAGAIAKARSEALAQLTERVPTIQLLRDGLFRACEAYANGALSQMSYAMMLGRYGDVMVTMLGQDLVAGDFGRQLAAISGSASGSANASAKLSDEETRNLYNKATEDISKLTDISRDLVDAQKAADGATTPQDKQHAEDKVSQLKEQQDDLSKKINRELTAAATSSTSATATAGAALAAQNISDVRAKTIADMQKTLISSPAAGPLLVACVNALANTAKGDKDAFTEICSSKDNNGQAFLSRIVAMQMEQPPPAPDKPKATPITADQANKAIKDEVANVSDLKKALAPAPAPVPAVVVTDAYQMVKDEVNRTKDLEKLLQLPGGTPPKRSAVDSGDPNIALVQLVLKQKGYGEIEVDGVLGPKTSAALKAFQSKNRIPATGLIDGATLKTLISS